MKIRNLHLKTLIISLISMLSFASQSWAEAPAGAIEVTTGDAGTGNSAIVFTGDSSTVINMNMVDHPTSDSALQERSFFSANNNSASNVAEIYVTSWWINNGSSTRAYTFNSAITGSGNITFEAWANGVNSTYTFKGDMSSYSGNITTFAGSAAITDGGLTLKFEGTARSSVAGTGLINTTSKPIEFRLDAGDATITNSSITGHTVNIYSASTVDSAPTNYTVSSDITATSAFNVGSRSHVTMGDGSSLTLGEDVSFFVSATGSLTFASGSVLDLAVGSVITAASSSSSLTLDAGSTLALDVSSTEASLTLGTLNFGSDSGQINLMLESDLDYVTGFTYDLISATDLSDFDFSNFNVDLGGSTADYTLQIVDNTLQLVITGGGAADLVWSGADGDTWSTADTSNSWVDLASTPSDFADGNAVTFSNAAGGSVNIAGDVAPSHITVSSTGDYSFDGAGSIVGATALIKEGSGKLTLNTTNSYTGGTELRDGTLSFKAGALGTGGLTVAGGSLEVSGGTAVSFASGQFVINAGANLNLHMLDTNMSVAGASASASHAITLTGSGTLSYDSWTNVSSLDLAAGTTFHFTGTNANSTVYKDISGEGRIITSNTSITNFRVENKSASETFTGTLQLNTGAALVLSMNHSTAANRIAVEMATSSDLIFVNSGSFSTIYLDKLSGEGQVRFDIGSTTRHLDLELSETNTFSGDFYQHESNSWGSVIIDSAAPETAIQKFILDGVGYTAHANATVLGTLSIQQAEVQLQNAAVWLGNIELAHADAQITFDNSTAITRTDAMGQISGNGTVVIDSAETVTFNAANAHTGTTQINAASTLALGHNDAAGTSTIEINSGTLSFANALTVTNTISVNTAATLTTTDAADVVNFTGTIAGSRKDVVTFDQGHFILAGTRIEGVTLNLEGGATLEFSDSTTFANTTLTGISVSHREDTFTTSEGGEHEDTNIYTLAGLEDIFNTTLEGELNLNLDSLTGFVIDDITAFELQNVTKLRMEYQDINIIIDGVSYGVQGETQPGGAGTNVMLYIPEPSTATLSMLALVGLLARRRRKQVA